ncbi:MAG: hypothetical protein IJ597_06425, partial [Synergistaceae bacterium]|nr:hypothetical protein [Synergistaceae bacterium]
PTLARNVIEALVKAGGDINAHIKSTPLDVSELIESEEDFAKYKSIFLPRSKWTSNDPFDNFVDVTNVSRSFVIGTLTPLMYAVLNDNADVVNILLEFGADANATSLDNKTALDYAKEFFENSNLKKSPAFEKLTAATNKSSAPKIDKNFDIADALVGQGKIPMYVRDKGKFIYNPDYFKIRVTGRNVNLRSQPNTKSSVVAQLSYDADLERLPRYLGEWTHPNGERWVLGEYRTDNWEAKTVWIFGNYAEPLSSENYDLLVKQASPEQKAEELIEFVRNRLRYREFSEELGYGPVGKQCEKFFSNGSWGTGTSGNKIFENQCVYFKGVAQNVQTHRRYMFTIFFNRVAEDSSIYGLKRGTVMITQINQNDKVIWRFDRKSKVDALKADIQAYEFWGTSLLSNNSANANEITLDEFLETIYREDNLLDMLFR